MVTRSSAIPRRGCCGGMVEAGGIEPPSGEASDRASTCVVSGSISLRRRPETSAGRGASPKSLADRARASPYRQPPVIDAPSPAPRARPARDGPSIKRPVRQVRLHLHLAPQGFTSPVAWLGTQPDRPSTPSKPDRPHSLLRAGAASAVRVGRSRPEYSTACAARQMRARTTPRGKGAYARPRSGETIGPRSPLGYRRARKFPLGHDACGMVRAPCGRGRSPL